MRKPLSRYEVLEIAVQTKALEATRTTEENAESLEVTFNVNSSISESDRSDGLLKLKFAIDFETAPSAARLHASGTATLTGREEEVEKLLAAREEDGTPTLFMKIYRRIYPTMYLLCGSMGVPYPSPALLRLSRTTTEEELVRQAEGKLKA